MLLPLLGIAAPLICLIFPRQSHVAPGAVTSTAGHKVSHGGSASQLGMVAVQGSLALGTATVAASLIMKQSVPCCSWCCSTSYNL